MEEQLLIRFLSKQCTPEEICQVSDWIEADDANKTWLFETERIWSLKDEIRFSDKKELKSAYNRFLSLQKKRKGNKRLYISWIKYAAAIFICAILSYNVYYHTKGENPEMEYNTVEVPAGQRVSLTLGDGTKVWLNSMSRFTYPVNFSKDKRIVRLEGEGYFEVKKEDRKSFIVEGTVLDAVVLGTTFNMKVYDEEAVVSLTTGSLKVRMKENDREVILHPKEKAVKQGEDLTVMPFTGEDDAMWKNGIIAFKETPLPEALKTLSRHYNATFELKNIHEEKIKITLKIMDEPLDVTLKYIRLATGINYKIIKNNSQEAVFYNVSLFK